MILPGSILDMVNVQNLSNPYLLKTCPMTGPSRLCKAGDLLFVCNGPDQVKALDAADPAYLYELSTLTFTGPNDLIASEQ